MDLKDIGGANLYHLTSESLLGRRKDSTKSSSFDTWSSIQLPVLQTARPPDSEGTRVCFPAAIRKRLSGARDQSPFIIFLPEVEKLRMHHPEGSITTQPRIYVYIYIPTEKKMTVLVAGCLTRPLGWPWRTGLPSSAGSCGFWPWAVSPSGAFGLAACRAQELTHGDNVRPATQLLLAALAHEVLSVPGQVFHTLVVL